MIKFINKVKFKLKQYILFKKKFYFYKNFFWNIVNNLTELNLINFYKDFNNYYSNILNKMELLKEYIDLFQNYLSITKYKYYKIFILRNKIISISNLITSKDITQIFELYSDNWFNNFNDEEIVQIHLLIDFVKPINIWDSNIHLYNIPLETKNQNDTLTNLMIKNILINNIINPEIQSEYEEHIINNIFNKDECINILSINNIIITKNNKATSLIENKCGCSIYIKINNNYIVIQGLFKDDLFNMSSNNPFAKKIIDIHLENIKLDLSKIPNGFYESYFNIINLRDKIVSTSKQLSDEIKKKHNDFKSIQGKPLMLLVNEFLLASKYRKIDILTLLLISNYDDQKLAFVLFDVFKSKDKKNIATEIYNNLECSIRKKLDISKINMENEENQLLNLTDSDISYERRISLLNTTIDVKAKAMEKFKSIKNNFQGDSKAQNWLDGLLKIPFGIYNNNEILSFKKNFIKKNNIDLISDYQIEQQLTNNSLLLNEWLNYKNNKITYLKHIRKTLDQSVYGHKEAKIQLERIFAQWINGENKGAVFGLYGPPGTGKTSLIKHGLSKCLKDANGNSRPFAFLPIGGSVNGSTLVGHNYTYVGSSWGRIVDILITSKCMNPIIFIDELDKISNTDHGREIISILTHLTDSTQNDEFEDKFFSGIKLDLSKVLFIFSFNDLSLIDYVLRDRITIIETHPLKINEKIVIIKEYILPDILKEVGFSNDEIIIDDKIIKYLIETYTLEAGVRKIKEKIIEIIREINVIKCFDDSIIFPFVVTQDFCNNLFESKQKIKIKKILDSPHVGIVNGLYASSTSIGGITFIQAIKFPSTKILDLNVTGSLGDSMKESIYYSLKLVYSLLSPGLQNDIINKPFGIHIHCPEGAVKKDGPSAGVAITLAIYSLITGIPVNNTIAITGEIDLVGNITAIGGLETKLNGAKSAGVKTVLFPEENMDVIEILKKENNYIEDSDFKIIPVKHINEIFKFCLI